jgi:hypothetical protein
MNVTLRALLADAQDVVFHFLPLAARVPEYVPLRRGTGSVRERRTD